MTRPMHVRSKNWWQSRAIEPTIELQLSSWKFSSRVFILTKMSALPRRSLFLFFSLLILACSRRGKIPSDTLIIGIESEVRNLDLRTTSDANSAHVIGLFAQSLLRANEQLLPITDLAKSFHTDDYKTYRFDLPEGATFHDGSILDCTDVLESFRQSAGPDSRIKSSFQTVKEFRCPTPLRFEIELEAPLVRFLMADVVAVRILPAEISKKLGEAEPIGSGPYRFVKRDDRDLHFERFKNFKRHSDGKLDKLPYYKRIIVRSLADPSIRWLSIVAGDIDALMNALSPLRVREAMKSERLQVFRSPGTTFQYLAINLKNQKFQDIRVRQALMQAINRESIVEHKLYGMATVAHTVLSPSNFFHNPEVKTLKFDPLRARTLLQNSGNLGIKIELKTSTDAEAVGNALVIVQQLRESGFDAELRSYEFGTFFGDITKGNFEIYSLRWTSVIDPDILQRIFHSKEFPPGRNRVFYENSEVDQLVERGAIEPDPQKRQKLYNKVQEIVGRDLPYIPLWFPDNIAILSPSINDFHPHPSGSWESLLKSTKRDD